MVKAQIRSEDELVKKWLAPLSNAVKINTEGFELEVLRGLGLTFHDRELIVVVIEIHLTLLQDGGLTSAPLDIESILERKGFKLCSTDISQVLAVP